MAAKEGDDHHKLLQDEDGGVGMMGKGGGGTDKTQGGGRRKIEGKGGQDSGGDHAWRCREQEWVTQITRGSLSPIDSHV
jgi:hypothetical protein